MIKKLNCNHGYHFLEQNAANRLHSQPVSLGARLNQLPIPGHRLLKDKKK